MFDFTRRVDLRKVNRRVLEALIRAGALDGLGPNRAVMMATLNDALKVAEQHGRNAETGQNDLFGLSTDGDDAGAESAASATSFADVPDWHEEQRLAAELETLGLYLSGHPITRYEPELKALKCQRLINIRPTGNQSVLVVGLVAAIRVLNSRRGQIAFVTLDDRTARIELTVYADTFQSCRDILSKGRILVVEGTVNIDERSGDAVVTANNVYEIEKARESYARRLLLKIGDADLGNGLLKDLAGTLEPFRQGRVPVVVDYSSGVAAGTLTLGKDWCIHPTDELIRRLGDLVGPEQVQIVY